MILLFVESEKEDMYLMYWVMERRRFEGSVDGVIWIFLVVCSKILEREVIEKIVRYKRVRICWVCK